MTAMTPSVRDRSDQRNLGTRIDGEVLTSADDGYAEAAQGWNLTVTQRPAVVVRPANRRDVQTAVQHAARWDLGVAVMSTGHGIVIPCDGGVLLDTSAMRRIEVDPEARRVRVEAGVVWREVIEALAPYGLTGLPGSSPEVGVVGYTLGGGFGWLGRRFGLAAHHIKAADVVTADGEFLRVTVDSHPDVFWALGGGTGNVGIVTALEFEVFEVPTVFGGNLYYPLERANDVLEFFAGWAPNLPVDMTAAATFRFFPPTPPSPEPLRGQRVAAIRGVHSGDRAEAESLVRKAREALGEPLLDTFAGMPTSNLASISLDPVQPLAFAGHSEVIPDLSPGLIGELVRLVGPDAGSALVMLELRTLGGALVGPAASLSPMAHTAARYSLNAVGLRATPQQEVQLRRELEALAIAVGPHATGESYLNFLDAQTDPARVRAAYTPTDLARLIEIKHRYDPRNRFRFNRLPA
jgi:FAD/FMN-containing dehydrogenase